MSVAEAVDVDLWFADGPHVLRNVSLAIDAGQHWALLGANGAGKSTLLSLLGAQRFPSRGAVRVLGRRLGEVDLREVRREIGMVDARLRIPPELTVSEYVATGVTQTVQPVAVATDEVRHRVTALLERFGLAGLTDRLVSVCSQGERARARLARALVGNPRLLLLDEPAAGLDLPGRADLLAAVEAAAADHPRLASVVVAHHLEELPGTTTHVALLRCGQVLGRGNITLLHDAQALSACFDRPVSAFPHEGRWFAVAR